MQANLIRFFPEPDQEGWVQEYRFHPDRQWRLDYAHPGTKVAIEVHGAVWTGGRHTRGQGFVRDREKMNAAAGLGWIVLEYSTDTIAREFGRVIDEITSTVRGRKAGSHGGPGDRQGQAGGSPGPGEGQGRELPADGQQVPTAVPGAKGGRRGRTSGGPR